MGDKNFAESGIGEGGGEEGSGRKREYGERKLEGETKGDGFELEWNGG